jgi:hypothetical protein
MAQTLRQSLKGRSIHFNHIAAAEPAAMLLEERGLSLDSAANQLT